MGFGTQERFGVQRTGLANKFWPPADKPHGKPSCTQDHPNCVTPAEVDIVGFLCSGAEFPWIPKPMPPSGPLLPQEEIMEIIQGSPILVLNIAGDADNSDAKKVFWRILCLRFPFLFFPVFTLASVGFPSRRSVRPQRPTPPSMRVKAR